MRKLIGILILSGIFYGTSALAALEPFQSFTGNVAVSTDGFGSSDNAGVISASVPTGATVLAAYLYSSTYDFSLTRPIPTVTLNGETAAFGPRVPNNTACCNLASFRADVTDIVKPIIDVGPGGVYDFDVEETVNGTNIDGESLVVVYQEASLPVATVGILDGFASVDGDTASINFLDPLAPGDPGFFAEMALGISFSCNNQRSRVEVNGSLLTENAGNYDDAENATFCQNGRLITVGSFDDPFSPANPSYADDTERYDLSSFVADGDTSITVDTFNASEDDNIFLATFYVSGIAGINENPCDAIPPPDGCVSDDDDDDDDDIPPVAVPEPDTLALFGLAILVLGFVRRRKQ